MISWNWQQGGYVLDVFMAQYGVVVRNTWSFFCVVLEAAGHGCLAEVDVIWSIYLLLAQT